MILLFLLVSAHAKKYNWCCKVTARKTPLFDFDRNLEIPPRSLIAKAKVYWDEMDVSLGEIKKLRKQERMQKSMKNWETYYQTLLASDNPIKGPLLVHYYSPKCANSMISSEHFYNYWKENNNKDGKPCYSFQIIVHKDVTLSVSGIKIVSANCLPAPYNNPALDKCDCFNKWGRCTWSSTVFYNETTSGKPSGYR